MLEDYRASLAILSGVWMLVGDFNNSAKNYKWSGQIVVSLHEMPVVEL